MPLETSILNLVGFELEDISGIDPVILKLKQVAAIACPHCEGRLLRIKDTFYRWVKHESLGSRRIWLYLKTRKFICQSCSRYFNERFPGILPYRRSTEAFRREVFEKHGDGIPQTLLSEKLGISSASIERWYHDLLERKIQELSSRLSPRVLGIDEHFFTRKEGYATTLCDLGKHEVYDVVLGRSEASLEGYLRGLPEKQRTRIVVIDLSETYRNIARRHFPRAKIIADRFHVIRLINHHFLKLWGEIDPVGRKNRGLLSLMRRHEFNLSPFQKIRLEAYFRQYPALGTVYEFKQKLTRLMLLKEQTKRDCKRWVPVFLDMIEALKDSGFETLKTLGKTLDSWSEEIVRMWRFSRSNGITEGFHNKMELIKRRAYGFKSFENYRLRVRALCA